MISPIHLNSFGSTCCSGIVCCFVKFAWSVHIILAIGPKCFFCALLVSNCANPSSTRGGQACWDSLKLLPNMPSTLKLDKSGDICNKVPPQAIPHASATCSNGRLPSKAAASSKTAVSIACLHIALIALTAISPLDFPPSAPSPFSGNSALGLMYSPRVFAAAAYVGVRYRLTQFVDPMNCLTCDASFNGGKSTIAWILSGSVLAPVLDTWCPNNPPDVRHTNALLTPKLKPETIDTSKNGSRASTCSMTQELALGNRIFRSSNSLS